MYLDHLTFKQLRYKLILENSRFAWEIIMMLSSTSSSLSKFINAIWAKALRKQQDQRCKWLVF